jgi:hypothetical protein
VQFEGNLLCFFLPPAKTKENPPHKTAHLQTAQTSAIPKFTKELFYLPARILQRITKKLSLNLKQKQICF